MGFVEIVLVGVGLSMDAFAASICKGLGMKRLDLRAALIIGLFFGGFQALMPVVGWLLGQAFEVYITAVDHWIAFALLCIIGGKMLWDAFHPDDEEEDGGETGETRLDYRELLGLAVATSIDALAVGITLAFLHVDIAVAAVIIGVTTFAISVAGTAIGHVFGSRFERPATIVGGVVLICIGAKILLEHLGILF